MPSLSDFPTTIDSYTADEDGVTTIHADDVNEARDFAIAAETKIGADADALSAATLEGRAKYQEAGGLKRGSSVASATSITLVDTAQVFPITGTTPIATIAAPSYPRLVYLECASALTLTHGSGNLTLPGAANLSVPAGAVVALEWTGSTWRVAGGGSDAPPVDPAANVGGSRTLGTGAQQAAAGNDSRLSDARTPTAHATSHVTVGQDPLPTFTATTRGLVPPPGGSPAGVKALYDNGTWADPAVASGGMSSPLTTEGGLIIGDASGDPIELLPGTDLQVVGVDPSDHAVKYIDVPSKHVIYDETSPVTDRPVLAFQGTGVTVTDDSLDGATLVTIPGGGFSSPMTTAGDLIKGGSSGTPGRLGIGSTGDVLTVSGGAPVWAAPSGGGGGGGGSLLWDPYGLAVPPVASSLSDHNQWSGSGILTTLDQEGDAVVFKNPGAGASFLERGAFGDHLSGPYVVPAPSYTATACLIPNVGMVNYWCCALSVRQQSNDKRIVFRVIYISGVMTLDALYLTDYQTTSGGSFGSVGWVLGFPIWIQIRDNGSTLFWEYARDGKWFIPLTTTTTGAHCTPDQAGITMNSNGGASGSQSAMTVLSLSVVNTA